MFTGLIQTVGEVVAIDPREPSGSGVRLRVKTTGWDHHPSPGDSICVSGCCLTLAEPAIVQDDALEMAFDVIPESLSRTKLGTLIAGSRVNIEPSCTPTSLLGGHVVQGHVEGLATIENVDTDPAWVVTLKPPATLMPCITPKGSITIDGISLTVAHVDPDAGTFQVALIPTTLDETTIGHAKVGEHCNIETDIMARTVVHYLRNYAQGAGA
ncbi:MAG: riboflavin synthase [Phycisphaerales bacterium]|nr:riboflavin synthase [Phycisphaerales bacterium]MCB9837464.1 riboflavin synthase [Phycisphaera sp.]